MSSSAPNKIIYSMVGVGKYYDKKPVIKDIYLSYFYGAKIGVIGLNGSGKSSLLRIIAGVDKEFVGETVISPGFTVGFLEQEPHLDESRTVREIVEEGVQENAFLVPQVGVTHDPSGKATALVVGPDNKVAIRPVQLRGTTGTQWIVDGGLNDGDHVVVAGVQKVQPGTLVQAVESQATTAAATPSEQTTTKATSAMPSASSTTSATTPATPSAPVKTAAAAGQAAQPPPGTPASQAK